MDNTLKLLVAELKKTHGCHTVILYGSRANGDFSSNSDFDVIGLNETSNSEEVRDARPWNGLFLDAAIYPETIVTSPDHSLIRIRYGMVLCQKDGLGDELLKNVNKVYLAGPKRLTSDKVQLAMTWPHKMLERAARNDIEGNFRRVWLLTALLEDHFAMEGMWYEGPKRGLKWVKENQPELYAKYDLALKPGASLEDISDLVHFITSYWSAKVTSQN
jgi:hypothetical protein